VKLSRRLATALSILLTATAFYSCTNQPSPVGSSLVPAQNKLTFRALNSWNAGDSLFFSYRIYPQHIAGGTALSNGFVGLYKTYQARELIKFIPLYQDSSYLDSAENSGTMQYAYIQVLLSPYRFGDTSTSLPMHLHCTVNQILTPYDLGATWDSLASLSNYSATPVGEYNGVVPRVNDSILEIPIDTAFLMQMFRNTGTLLWQYALLPQSGTTGITGIDIASLSIHVVTLQNATVVDSPVVSGVQMLYIASSDEPNTPNEMTMQTGIQQRLHLYMQTSEIPKFSTINAASLRLTLDTVNSVFGDNHIRDSLGLSSIDTIFLAFSANGDSLDITNTALTPAMGTRIPGTSQYYFPYVAPLVQSWVQGVANYGMVPLQGFSATIGTGDQFSTLDKFVFYSPTDPDTSHRAHLQVLYSTQAPQ